MEEEQPSVVLKRRNSIAANSIHYSPINQSLHTSTSLNGAASSPKIDLELLSLKSSCSYTSLRDLLPSPGGVNSPTAAQASASPFSVAKGSEIPIRNRLVKQAAWAYLQPMSSSPCSSGPTNFLRRLWLRLSAFLRFINYRVARLVDRILR